MRNSEIPQMIEAIGAAASELGSRNTLSVEAVRRWLSEYLRMHDEDVGEFPDEKGADHWDLLMADFDPTRDALFIAAVFIGGSVRIATGRGEGGLIRVFVESEFPEDPNVLIPELSRKFNVVGEPLVFDRAAFLRWVMSVK